jgi:Zn-dependent protease with chaperone function
VTFALAADYFDGLSTRAVPVTLRVEAGFLHVDAREPMSNEVGTYDSTSAALQLRVPISEVQWPERTRHGARQAHLRGSGTLRALDAGAWDEWARGSGIVESRVVRAQQSWRNVLIAVAALAVLVVGVYLWGVPLLARAALASTPAMIDQRIGTAALASLDSGVLLPSAVPAARQREVREAFDRASARAYQDGRRPTYELQFRTSRKAGSSSDARTFIGPNAFALPGGTIVVTDEMLDLLHGRDDVLTGVLGHELGHVRLRHGMRLVLQASIIGVAGTIAWGDFSSVFAAVPVLLGQSAYSRDFEREADGEAIRLLRANGLSPMVMVDLFDRLAEKRAADAERIATFKAAAAGP